ncbi:MAG TPA: thiamine diphosphokinase [Gammaproteobacteria bacterium]|jgi:thiamine pyrophosphokinase|nr:thiamine diphosphokinase [Gammaproteobacteria bacterium]
MLNDKKFRAILTLNGDLPEKEFFNRDIPVIAADGAANKLAAMCIKPSKIIGDLDSVHQDLLEEGNHVHDPDQSASDFEKALHYMKENDLLPAIITGVNGGYLDHVLHNINIFLQTDSIIYAPPMIGMIIKSGENVELSVTPGAKISLLGLPSAMVSSNGLKWELNHHELAFPGYNSCFNRAARDHIEITVQSGNILMLIYQQVIADAGL